MVVSVGAYTLLWGWRFAALFVVLIFVHELGHALWLKREGIPAGAPVFIPFLGALISMRGRPQRRLRRGQGRPRRARCSARSARPSCSRLGEWQNSDLLRAAAHTRLPAQPLQPAADRAARRRPRDGRHPPGALDRGPRRPRGAADLRAQRHPHPDPRARRARGLDALALAQGRRDRELLPRRRGPPRAHRGALHRHRGRVRARACAPATSTRRGAAAYCPAGGVVVPSASWRSWSSGRRSSRRRGRRPSASCPSVVVVAVSPGARRGVPSPGGIVVPRRLLLAGFASQVARLMPAVEPV